jgi:WD40 repeat protein
VSGSGDKTVRLWDAVTGTLLQTLKGHSSEVTSVAFSPDSKRVVSGSVDRTVRIWDTVTGVLLQTLEGHWNIVISVAFSPDSKRVVFGSTDDTVQLWDTVTGTPLQTLKGHSNITLVAFSPDGTRVVSGSRDKTLQLWDAVTGSLLQTLEGHLNASIPVAFSPDGKLEQGLFVSNNWVVEGKEQILWLPPEYRAICQAAWDKVIVLGHPSGKVSILRFFDGLKHIAE